MMKIGAIVQARFSASRLPGKVLKELPYGSGITVLEQVIRRLKRSKKIDSIVIATTTDARDKKIADIAAAERVKCLRGSKEDVLSRYYAAAKDNALDIIVRITADCPCTDPAIVDSCISRHIESKADYTSNCLRISYPRGLEVEVLNFGVLKRLHKDAKKDYEREHVTAYIPGHPGEFKMTQVDAPKGLNAPDVRFTLDTEEDYALLCLIFDSLYSRKKDFSARDVLGLFHRKPWLKLINKRIVQKKVFTALEEELKEALAVLELQDLKRAAKYLKKISTK